MKKLFTFLFAALLSVSLFAAKDVVPADNVLSDYYNNGDVCVCIFVPADLACNDVVLTGSFNGWSTNVANCPKFEDVEGYDGWFVASFEPEAEPDMDKGMQAMPVILSNSGTIDMKYKAGAATAIRGAVWVRQGAVAGEIELTDYGADAPNVFTIDVWKNNPCTEVPPVAIDYYLVGTMNNWQADAAYKFAANTQGAEGEYVIYGVDLVKDDSIKVIGTDGNTATWYPNNAPNYAIPKDGSYNIYFRPDGQGGNDWYYKYFYAAEVVDKTVIYVAFPSANRPTYISVGGTFKAGQWGMRIFNEPWFTADEDLYTGKGDVLKFRDSDNANYVLCENKGGNWVQLLLYCKDYDVVKWKGDMVRVIEELDFSDANKYAWKENMPEPDLTAIINTTVDTKAAKSIINGMLLIEKNGKYFNVLGQPLR